MSIPCFPLRLNRHVTPPAQQNAVQQGANKGTSNEVLVEAPPERLCAIYTGVTHAVAKQTSRPRTEHEATGRHTNHHQTHKSGAQRGENRGVGAVDGKEGSKCPGSDA